MRWSRGKRDVAGEKKREGMRKEDGAVCGRECTLCERGGAMGGGTFQEVVQSLGPVVRSDFM
jgi:hypothetical protein